MSTLKCRVAVCVKMEGRVAASPTPLPIIIAIRGQGRAGGAGRVMVCHGVSGAGRVRPRERAAVSGAAIRRSYQAWQLYGADIAASRRAVRLGSVIGPWGACRGCSILWCVPQGLQHTRVRASVCLLRDPHAGGSHGTYPFGCDCPPVGEQPSQGPGGGRAVRNTRPSRPSLRGGLFPHAS